jgi:hypothetical protein
MIKGNVQRRRTLSVRFRFDTASVVLSEGPPVPKHRTEASKAAARLRLSHRQLQTETHRLTKLLVRSAAESATFHLSLLPRASPAVVPEAGKQKKTPKDTFQPLICLKKVGAGEGIRTLDPDLGNKFGKPARSHWCGWSESNRHFREETRFCIPLWLSPRRLCLAASALCWAGLYLHHGLSPLGGCR